MKKVIYSIIMLMLISCGVNRPYCSNNANWNRPDSTRYEADIFYVVSTNVQRDSDAFGNELYNATLTPPQRASFDREINFIKHNIGDSTNVYSPYYHQFTMDAILLSPDSFKAAYRIAQRDVLEAFNYYATTLNPDRPFAIVGFSQGAKLVADILRHMPERVYQRCVGAYMAGYRLSAEDIRHPHLQPMRSETEGMVASFNTVSRVEDSWDFIAKDAATCTNPLNWSTAATPVQAIYRGDTISVTVDTIRNILVVKGLDEDKHNITDHQPWFSKGCLHIWDLTFYTPYIRQNILDRLRHYRDTRYRVSE